MFGRQNWSMEFNFLRKYLYTVLSSIEKKYATLYTETLQSGSLFYLIVPRDPLLRGNHKSVILAKKCPLLSIPYRVKDILRRSFPVFPTCL